jgi:hypothetical protein
MSIEEEFQNLTLQEQADLLLALVQAHVANIHEIGVTEDGADLSQAASEAPPRTAERWVAFG